MEKAVNTFTSGMNLDLAPLATPNTVLTDCLNGTMITFNGNELILQNDMGNCKVGSSTKSNGVITDGAELPKGYVPVGMQEHGGIIYVASYNPETLMSQLGSFPSPERNVEDEFGNTNKELPLPEKPGLFTLIPITTDKIRSGDSIYVWLNELTYSKLTPTFKNKSGDLYDGLNRKYSITMTVMGSDGTLIDQTESFLPQKFITKTLSVDGAGNVIPAEYDYYWYALTSPEDNINYTIYNGISGIPYLKIQFNGILDLDLDVLLTKSISNSNFINLQVNADYLFNCPYLNETGFAGVVVKYWMSSSVNEENNEILWNSTGTSEYLYFPMSETATKASDGYTIHLSQVINNINPGDSKFIKYEVTPYFNYGTGETYEIDSWTVRGLAEIAKISSGVSTINTWKYRYESPNDIYITWGMESYPSGINSLDIPKDITFLFYSLNDITNSNLTLSLASGNEVYNPENTYFDINGSDISSNLNNLTIGKTISIADVYSKHLPEPDTIIKYNPELRSNYNGVFTENLTDFGFIDGTCYLVEIKYTINDGTKDITNTYYRWVITTGLYNDEYYESVMDFNNITAKTSIPAVTITTTTKCIEGSNLQVGESLNVLLEAPSEANLSGTNNIISRYSYQLDPKYTISWDNGYPVTINFPEGTGLVLNKDKVSSLAKNDITFSNNLLLYIYKQQYNYIYKKYPISITNFFQTYELRNISELDHMYEVVFSAHSTNENGDYNRYECYYTVYDMKGNVKVKKTRCQESLPHGYVAINEDNGEVWKAVNIDIEKVLNTLSQQEMGLIALVVIPAIFTKTEGNPGKDWYGVRDEWRNMYTDIAYNFIVSTEGDPMFLNKHFIVDTNCTRSVEDNGFVSSSILYNNIMTNSKTYVNVTSVSNSDTYTYTPSTLSPLPVKYNPYQATGILSKVAVCIGPSIVDGYFPEITSDATEDYTIDEEMPLEIKLPEGKNLSLYIVSSDSDKIWKSKLGDLNKIVLTMLNFNLTNTVITSSFTGLESQFEHVIFGSNKAVITSGDHTMQCLILCDNNSYVTPGGELSSDLILKCSKNNENEWEFKALNGLYRVKINSLYHAVFKESDLSLSRLIGVADRYLRGKEWGFYGDHIGVLFRFPTETYITNASEVVTEGALTESKP